MKEKNGYHKYSLYLNGVQSTYLKHRLVANNFLPPPTKEQIEWAKTTKYNTVLVNHKNGIKSDCHYSNLEWATGTENSNHAYENNLTPKLYGYNNKLGKLSKEDTEYIINNYVSNSDSVRMFAKQFNVSESAIRTCLRNFSKEYKEINKRYILTNDDIEYIINNHIPGEKGWKTEFSIKALAEKFKVGQTTIRKYLKYKQ